MWITSGAAVYLSRAQRPVLLIACMTVLVAPARAVTSVSCGATVLTDMKLDHDLVCAAAGLLAGADEIEIDLNGYSITGSGASTGINVSGRRGVSIVGGTIANFTTGVLSINSVDTSVKGNTFLNNGDGVDVQAGSTGLEIKENVFVGSRTRAIMLRSNTVRTSVVENRFTANRVGILLFGAIDSIVRENVIETSDQAGIRVQIFATGNLVGENLVTSNPIGIDFLLGPSGGPAGNTFRENTIASNVCGLKGPSGANTLTENVFVGNGADHCS